METVVRKIIWLIVINNQIKYRRIKLTQFIKKKCVSFLFGGLVYIDRIPVLQAGESGAVPLSSTKYRHIYQLVR